MAFSIPEELLHDILSYRLYVPVDVFCEFPETGNLKYLPNQKFYLQAPNDNQAPAGDVLRVCKQWLRIGTPILYESVRIGKSSQAAGFAALLQARPYIGELVRNLRLEGGFEQDLRSIIAYLPNVHTIYVSCQEVSSDSQVNGVAEALPDLNPKRALIHAPQWYNGKMRSMIAAVGASLAKWRMLESVTLSKYGGLPATLASSLRHAPSLREISMDGFTVWELLRAYRGTETMQTIVENPSLKKIRCREGAELIREVIKDRNITSKVTKLLVYEEDTEDRQSLREAIASKLRLLLVENIKQ